MANTVIRNLCIVSDLPDELFYPVLPTDNSFTGDKYYGLHRTRKPVCRSALLTFINDTLLPEAGKDEASFWTGFDEAVHQLAPRNAELLDRRETLQSKLDNWLKKRREKDFDEAAYTNFLREIGYIVDEGDDFVISTEHVDAEIATIAGPQVVPVMNTRYALNAPMPDGAAFMTRLRHRCHRRRKRP